ncbi:uncharacterized protein TrAFT101_000780 [Trichoderma asperellum]|uniref:Cyclin N-terminal domain-containing protein n=1 Tax=Trichoderma asperellum (strain ATCC 204424 / CBS 433.97 / NBRC 101777) TaxID=1042311 RepID=A0A2T3ZKJ2_TRIA4|nr:hypothetical protein M441DRAFT_23553 [Trichoderma asperellum CBS 433.97]PTB45327.1 hypothetical protein M441DRAFT_23553 [Trichoderma asperellum CBS 433.97]UKZ84891.1 hypothetical protein TrAFT101_000780 [Trichoderma asperellum]
MPCDTTISPAYDPLSQYSYSSSASSSLASASVWSGSDTASQTSDDASVSTTSSDNDSWQSVFLYQASSTANQAIRRHPEALNQQQQSAPIPIPAVPAELRQNPRRTASSSGSSGCHPPSLVRQSDRKVNFVDSLVDSSTQIVEAIWPLSSAPCRPEPGNRTVLPLRTFIQETLRRSRTSYSTLQVALYYLVLIKPHVSKRGFTAEQYEDRYSDRALQCGRRMFLAALILASKYLQDRNYSARAWSKISGLGVQEINQNEVAFLLAVNWKLHITDEVFQRWTEIVLKHTPPPPPPSPGAFSQTLAQQTLKWKQAILKLNPDLTNIEGLMPTPHLSAARSSDLCALSPRSILNLPVEQQQRRTPSVLAEEETCDPKLTTKYLPAMEPTPVMAYSATPGRMAPTLGLLPTPRLTPQSSGMCTPAASAASQLLGRSSAMGLAMAQAGVTSAAAQHLERFPTTTLSTSPQNYCPARRSSLANSISTMSSPESMVSDLSHTSRSSSVSSASSLASATLNNPLMAQSRFRLMKAMNERASLKTTIHTVSESSEEYGFSSSPESYTGPVAKIGGLRTETSLSARYERELERQSREAASDAARTLQDLHNQSIHSVYYASEAPKTGTKRSRTASLDQPLQDHVREMLGAPYGSTTRFQQPALSTSGDTRKRLCCSTEAATGYQVATGNHNYGLREPSFWEILN